MIDERDSERTLPSPKWGWDTSSPIANMDCFACAGAQPAFGSRPFLSLTEGPREALSEVALGYFDRGLGILSRSPWWGYKFKNIIR